MHYVQVSPPGTSGRFPAADLVKQLDMLKTINAKLMDERDCGLGSQVIPAGQHPGERWVSDVSNTAHQHRSHRRPTNRLEV